VCPAGTARDEAAFDSHAVHAVKLAVTIDVEEEGLFRGTYDSARISTTNVPSLALLDSVFREFDIHPTLLVSYQVASNPSHRSFLLGLKEKWRAEIGAHLHHWNTPPLKPLPHPDPVCSQLMPRGLLSAKLDSLFQALGLMGIDPVSFRMGRFNLGSNMFSVLERTSIEVDSSIAPMRKEYGGPDHLDAPADPYFPDPENPCRKGSSRIVEVPITVLPLMTGLGSFLERLSASRLVPASSVAWCAKYLLCLPVQPMATGLVRLKAGTRVHDWRKGQVITLFFHSSELVPGGCPQHPTQAAVDRFLVRLRSFFGWLRKEMHVESLTLSQIGNMYRGSAVDAHNGPAKFDGQEI
jgi:hypothetical protein